MTTKLGLGLYSHAKSFAKNTETAFLQAVKVPESYWKNTQNRGEKNKEKQIGVVIKKDIKKDKLTDKPTITEIIFIMI